MVSYKELIGFIGQFIRRQKVLFSFIFLLDSLAWPLEILVWPYILHLVVDIFTTFDLQRDAAFPLLMKPIILAVSLTLFVETISRLMGFLMARASPKLGAQIRIKMFDHIQRHSPHYFNERFAGSLANKITDMVTQVDALLQLLFWPLLPALITCMAAVVILWFIHHLFAIILLVWILLHLGVTILFIRPVDAYEHRHGKARSRLLGKIVDSLTNNFAVNLFYRFSGELQTLLPFQRIEEKTNAASKKYIEKMSCLTSLFYFLGIFLWLNGSMLYFWLHNQLTTGELVQVFNMIWNLTGIMWIVSRELPSFFQALGIAKQAYSVMKDPQDIEDKPYAKPLKITTGEIVFENVSFSYGRKTLFENKHVKIRGGEKVGLVGYTGAGKSTFINLILRFFPLSKGKILIDGQEISQVTLESLRRQIALIPQDPALFHRSLKDNICYGKPNASREEMIKAAHLAHCEEFINHTPGGYDAKIGERGTKLSGGEKQRVAIARAILVNAPILLLDEATSSLDSVTEKYIQESLEKLMENRTTIVIAHRLSTLSRMDRILVFGEGKIIEEGTHASLLKKKGHYASMWKMQVGGFLPETPSL